MVKYNDKYVTSIIRVDASTTYNTTYTEWGAEVLKHGSVDLRPSSIMSVMMPSGNTIGIGHNSYKFGRVRFSGSSTVSGAWAQFFYPRR